MKKINTGHFLMGVRLDVWLRLLRENRSFIDREHLPQAAVITATSLATAPAALAEKLIYRSDRSVKLEKDPIFIIGHWRSGTTYLQNLLTRDPQFGWADPVNTVLHPFSRILGNLFTSSVAEGIRNGRPMDNVQYSMDLPMEETFALLTVSPHSIIHMLSFPENYDKFISEAFIDDRPLQEIWEWRQDYQKVLRKLSAVNSGRQLVLKSPDNTAHLRELMALYPDARYINIHRDPYKTVRSTVHMFTSQIEVLRLTAYPPNFDEVVEDTVIGIFERMYRELFALEPSLPHNRYCSVAYSDFCADPIGSLQQIYEQLELDDFEKAKPLFEQYAESQKNYRKNQFEISDRLREKINSRLGFYFDRYGYEKIY